MKKTVPFTLDQAKEWRTRFGTPFYVYDEKAIKDTVKSLQKAFSWNKGFTECFAVKAAPTPAIIRLLASLGCGTDCASISEVVMSQACGLKGKKIMFTSNETSFRAYRTAVAAKAIINLDDITQIEVLERSCGIPDTVCLRYNPGSFSMTSEIMGNQRDTKFGMTYDQLIKAYVTLQEKGVKHFGIHCMAASCCLDDNYYPKLANMLFKIVVEMKKLGINIEIVDLGGGIGIPYRPSEKAVDIHAIGEGVRLEYDSILAPQGIKVAIYTELGRWITGPNGYLVASVHGRKDTYKKYVGLDASACDLMRPAMYGAYHHMTVLGKEKDEPAGNFDVVGGLCENNDKFAIDRALPKTNYGDIIVIHDAGAHGRSMGYNYNGLPRCGELLMNERGQVKLIRRSESLDDIFATFDVDEDFNYQS